MPTQVLQVCREAFEFLTQSKESEACKLERIIEISNVDEIKIVADEYLPAGISYQEGCANFVIVGTRAEIDSAISLINYEVRNYESTNKVGSKDHNRNLPVSGDVRASESKSQLDVDQKMKNCNIGKKMEEMVSSLLRSPDIRLPVTFHPDPVTNNTTSKMTNGSTYQPHRKRYEPYGKRHSAVNDYQEVVHVPHSVAGVVFGKGYLSVAALREEFDVAVTVIPPGSDASYKCDDIIEGYTPVRLKGVKEQVARARRKLDLDVREAENQPDFSRCVKETIVVEKCDIDLLVGLGGQNIQKAREIRGVKKIKREADFEHSFSYAIYADDKLAADRAKKILTERAKEQMVIPRLLAQKVADEIANLKVVSRVKLFDLKEKHSGDTKETLLVLEGQADNVAVALRILRDKLKANESRRMAKEPQRVISSKKLGFVILPTAVNIPENLRSATISKTAKDIILPTSNVNLTKVNRSKDSNFPNTNPILREGNSQETSQSNEMNQRKNSQSNEPNLRKNSQSNEPNLWKNSQSNEPNLRKNSQSNEPNLWKNSQSNEVNLRKSSQSNEPNLRENSHSNETNMQKSIQRNENILQNISQRNQTLLRETHHSNKRNPQKNIQSDETILRKKSESNERNSRETSQSKEPNLRKITQSYEAKYQKNCQSDEPKWPKTNQSNETDPQNTSQDGETNSLFNKTEVVQVPNDVAGRVFGKKYIYVRATQEEYFLKRVYVVKREEIAANTVEKGIPVVNGYVPVVLFGENDNVKRGKTQLERDILEAQEKWRAFYSSINGSTLEIDAKNMDLMLGPNGKTLQKARDLLNMEPFIGRIRRESESPQLYTYEIRCNDENAIYKVKKLLTEFRKDEIEVPKAIADELRDKCLARNMVARVISPPPGKGPNVKITLEGELDDVVAAKTFIYDEWQARRKLKYNNRVGKTVFVNSRTEENIHLTSENQKNGRAYEVDAKCTSNDVFNKALGNVIRKYGFQSFKNQPLAYADYICKDNARVEVILTEGIHCEALVVDLVLDAVVVSLEGYKCATHLVVPFDKVRLVRESAYPNEKFYIGNEVHAQLNFKSEYAKCDLWCSGVVKLQSQKDAAHFPDLYLVEFTAEPLRGLSKRLPSNKMRHSVGSVALQNTYFSSAVVPVDKFDAEVINQITRPNAHKSYLASVGADMFVYDASSSRIILISKKKFDLRRVTDLSASHFAYLRSLSKSAVSKIQDLRDIVVSKPICEIKGDGPVKSISKFAQSSTAKKSINESANPCPCANSQNQNSSCAPYSKIASTSNSNGSNSNVDERALYSEKFSIVKNVIQTAIGAKGCNIKKVEKMPGISEITFEKPTIEIFGKNVECVKKARSVLEYRLESFLVKSSLVGSIIGKNGCNVKTIEKTSGAKVSTYNFTPTTKQDDDVTRIELLGPARDVCHAKILIENLVPTLLLSYNGMKYLDEQNRLDLEVEANNIGKATVIDVVKDCGKLGVESENGRKVLLPFSQVKFPQFSKFKGPITGDTFYKVEIQIEEKFGAAAESYNHRNFQIATCASSCIYRQEAHVLRLVSRTARTKKLVEILKDAHLGNVKKAQSCALKCNSIEDEETVSFENEKTDDVDQNMSSCYGELAFTVARSFKIPPHLIAHVNENGLSVNDFVVRDKILSIVRNQPGITSTDLIMDNGCLSLKIRSLDMCKIEQAAKFLDYVQDEIVIPSGTSKKIARKLKLKCEALIEFDSSQDDEDSYTVIGTPSSVSRAKELYSQYLDEYGKYYLSVNIAQSENLRQYMSSNLQIARDMPGICSVEEYPDRFAIYANDMDCCKLAAKSLTFACERIPAQQPTLTPAILDDIAEKCGVAEIRFTADKMGRNNVYKIIGPVANLDGCKNIISQMEIKNLASESSLRTSSGENPKGNGDLPRSSMITGASSSNCAEKIYLPPDLQNLEKPISDNIKMDDLASNSSSRTSVGLKSKESVNPTPTCSSMSTGPRVTDIVEKSNLRSDFNKIEISRADYICRVVKVDPDRVTDRIVKLSKNVTGIRTVNKFSRNEYEIKGDSKKAIDLAESALNYVEKSVTVEGFITFSVLDSKVKKAFICALSLELEKQLESDVARNVNIDYTLSADICSNSQFTFVTAYIVGPEKFVESAKNLLDSDTSKLGKYFVFMEIGNVLRRFEKECLPRSRRVEGVTCVAESQGGMLICGLTQASCLLAYQILTVKSVAENIPRIVADKMTSSVLDKIKKDTGILDVNFLPASRDDENYPARIFASEVDLKKVVDELKKYVEKVDGCPIQ